MPPRPCLWPRAFFSMNVMEYVLITCGSPRARSVSPNEGVRILTKGVLPSLSSYYGETESTTTHSLHELFFNMTFIHRTYCLTYTAQREMFLPVADCRYVRETNGKQAYLTASLSADLEPRRTMNILPSSFVRDASSDDPRAIRSTASVSCSKSTNPTATDLSNLIRLHREIRGELCYINGPQTLWYVKALVAGPRRLSRQPPTMVLAAMHRLAKFAGIARWSLRLILRVRRIGCSANSSRCPHCNSSTRLHQRSQVVSFSCLMSEPRAKEL
jgi:hypothetical protein